MASLSRNKKTGLCRILFFFGLDEYGQPKRNTLRVGKMSKKAGEAIQDRVADLVASAVAGSAPHDRTAEWVGSLKNSAPAVRQAGQARPGQTGRRRRRGRAPAVPTVAEFIDGYLADRSRVGR